MKVIIRYSPWKYKLIIGASTKPYNPQRICSVSLLLHKIKKTIHTPKTIFTYIGIDSALDIIPLLGYFTQNKLHALDIRYFNCDHICEQLITIIKSNTLHKLYLVGNELTNIQINDIIDSLEKNDNLQKLSFSSNDLSNNIIVIKLIHLLKKQTQLKGLYIGHCKIGCIDLCKILHTIKYKPITRLHLSYTILDKQVCKYIAKIIKINSIYRLDLNNSTLSDEDFKYICNALKHNTSLKIINLGYNKLTHITTYFFKILVKYGVELYELYFSQNNICCKYLCKYLKKNTSLYILHIWCDNFKEEECIYITKRLIHNKNIYDLVMALNVDSKPLINYYKGLEVLNHSTNYTVTIRNRHNREQRCITLQGLLKN